MAPASPSERPNILFIFTDDHGAQTISAYGSTRNSTPNIDRIAAEGIRFTNAFCGNSICAPSRATILTGTHSHVNGNTTNERIFDSRQHTFPEMLRDAGYQTALFGKWHLNCEPKGFETWDILINQGVYYNPPMIRNGQYTERTGYTTDIITDLTLEWLRSDRDPDRPFLLLYHHKAPHRSWEPPLRYLRLFDDTALAVPPTFFDNWSDRSSAWSHAEMSIEFHLTPGDLHLHAPVWQLNTEQLDAWNAVYEPKNRAFRDAKLAGTPLLEWKYQRFAKDYLRTVAAVDDGVGRILDYLEESGLAANTVLIYSSDQGWYLGEHGMFDKRWMYEESLRMPFLVRWPEVIRPGGVNADLVQNIDVAPTILELAGLPAPSSMQGRSLLPLLRGERPPGWRRSIYYQFFEDDGAHRVPRHYGIRTDRYKLIHYYLLGEWELFDLQNDPSELQSLYGRPGHEALTRDLTLQLDSLRKVYGISDEADREATVFQQELRQRHTFASLLGHMPSRWGVEVERLGVDTLDTYLRERVAYRVGDEHIEAYVLLPLHRPRPLPAILVIHPGAEASSYAAGKSRIMGLSRDTSLSFALDLCRQGFAVLCPDRPGFESRRLLSSSTASDEEALRIASHARTLLMNNSTLLGQEVAELWVAASYLAKRPEVHALRVGVAGYGEGGLLATILTYLNREILVALSINGTCPWGPASDPGVFSSLPGLRDLITVPGIARWGTIDEVIAGLYPKPFLEITTERSRDSLFARAVIRYRDRAFSDRLRLMHADAAPGTITAEMRQAIRAWFTRWLIDQPEQ